MSRMSALTTFRLIGSPTKPGCPYWRPCSDCLSFAGDMPTGGVGIGFADKVCWAGSWPSLMTAFFVAANTPAAERHTSERTSAVLLMADSARDSENIVPSLGGFQRRDPRANARLPGQIKRAPHGTRPRPGVCQKGAGGSVFNKHQRR